jgi:hypothetical protein
MNITLRTKVLAPIHERGVRYGRNQESLCAPIARSRRPSQRAHVLFAAPETSCGHGVCRTFEFAGNIRRMALCSAA